MAQRTQTAERTQQATGPNLNRKDQPPAPRAQPAESALPAAVVRRGIDEETWRTLCNSVFPGALGESILMAIDYCRARNLNVLKKPCHIVPMLVTQKSRGEGSQVIERKIWRDVILPGIYEYRITAHRTGEYLGHSEPKYGDPIDFPGLAAGAPSWCAMTMYRWHAQAREKIPFPVKVYFAEVVATKNDGTANKKWSQSPIQMLTKCTEAAGLREAFPDELGGLPTGDEMEGRTLDAQVALPAPSRVKPTVQPPRATNGARDATASPGGETDRSPDATEGAPAATAEAAAAEAPATAEQLAHVRKLIDATGVPENETCEQFGVETLEGLKFDQVAGVIAWIERVGQGA